MKIFHKTLFEYFSFVEKYFIDWFYKFTRLHHRASILYSQEFSTGENWWRSAHTMQMRVTYISTPFGTEVNMVGDQRDKYE